MRPSQVTRSETSIEGAAMGNIVRLTSAGLVGAALMCATAADAEDIRGTIVRTLILSETSRLVGDVTCQVSRAACIAFGAPHIALYLNGFTITGQADPATGCKGTSVGGEVGISTNGQTDVGVSGPGVVQRFQADGILFMATTQGQVEGVTTTTNCLSGIRINATSSRIRVEGNISVRNGTTVSPCGGI
jgi:hypothetical protein